MERMAVFTWHTEDLPAGMTVRQVYGFCFDKHGRVLMRVDGGKYGLPGGRPESTDLDLVHTLARECAEEVSIDIRDAMYLGFQRVDECGGTQLFAQIRMVARIADVHSLRPDPDTGRIYRRFMTAPKTAARLLAWGEVGRLQLADAARVAENRLGLPRRPTLKDSFI